MPKKDFKYYNGKYFQGSLTDNECYAILALLSDYDSVQSLKHCIKNIPEFMRMDIMKAADEYKKNNGTMKGFKVPFNVSKEIGTLRDEQTLGVAFLYYAQSALLGDEVGLGKTVQIAGLMNILRKEHDAKKKPFRMLFLAEKSTAGQIQEKLIQFSGEYVELLDNGETKTVENFINYYEEERNISVVGTHSLVENPLFITYLAQHPFDLIVFDESSALKKTTSTMYKNCKVVFPLHKRIVLLNATPIETNIRDIYNQLDLLDPNYMPLVGDFNRAFTKTKRTAFGYQPDGFKNQDIFKEGVKLRYLARTRQELGAKYTDNRYKTILVPLSPTQKKLNSKTTLKYQVADYPPGVDRKVEFNENTTPKLAVLNEILHHEIKPGETQALVYIRFVEAQEAILDILQKQGYRACILNGRTKVKERKELADAYNKGEYDVMITNVLKGLDLSTCDVCILYSIDPNPQKMVQFEGRMTRDFNVEYKAVYLLVSMGKEKELVEERLKLRVDASAAFAKTGNSMVLKAISTGDNRAMFETEEDKKKRMTQGVQTVSDIRSIANSLARTSTESK